MAGPCRSARPGRRVRGSGAAVGSRSSPTPTLESARVTDTPSSPAASRLATPSWLDARLVLGVLLVLVSVVVGARLLASADSSTGVWSVARDLAPGSTLAAGDLERRQVRLTGDDLDRYLTVASGSPVGYVLTRGVGRGELLPRAGIDQPQALGSLRDVSVPVEPGHLPDDLAAGQVVDVYLTLDADQVAAATAAEASRAAAEGRPAAAVPAGTQRLLTSITVRDRPGRDAAQGAVAVVLTVRQVDAQLLVSALQTGGLDLVRVPRAEEGLRTAAAADVRAGMPPVPVPSVPVPPVAVPPRTVPTSAAPTTAPAAPPPSAAPEVPAAAPGAPAPAIPAPSAG